MRHESCHWQCEHCKASVGWSGVADPATARFLALSAYAKHLEDVHHIQRKLGASRGVCMIVNGRKHLQRKPGVTRSESLLMTLRKKMADYHWQARNQSVTDQAKQS